MITAAIILMLFSVQSRGTERIGKAFGSVVLVWFSFLAVVGLANLSQYWSVFAALNPVYGVRFLFSSHNAAGLAIMGTVFLSTPVPKRFIPTWVMLAVATSISRGRSSKSRLCSVISAKAHGCSIIGMISAYIRTHGLNPFFEMMTPSVRYVAVVLSVVAGVIASQALITGAFTMVSEATHLNWMPHLQVRYRPVPAVSCTFLWSMRCFAFPRCWFWRYSVIPSIFPRRMVWR